MYNVLTSLRLISTALAVGAIALSSGSADAASSADKPPVKIGYIDPFVGQALFFTDDNRDAARAIVEKINESGGILGRKIELIIRDDKLKPDEARRLAKDLIVRDRVDFLTGTTAASEALAVSEVAKTNRKIFFAQFALSSTLVEKEWHPYVFQPHMSTHVWCGGLGYLAARFKYKKWAIINPDYEFGRSCGGDFLSTLKKYHPDVEIVATQWPKFGAADMTAEIGAILAAKPDAIYTSTWGGQIVTLIKQLKAVGAFPGVKLFGSLPTSVAVTLGKEFPEEGVFGGTPIPFDYKPFENFAQEFHARYNRWPSDGAVFSTLPYLFLKAAAEKAGSLETNAIIKALRGLTVETPFGAVTVREWDHSGNLGTCGGWFKMHPVQGIAYMEKPECLPGDELLPTKESWIGQYGDRYKGWENVVALPE